MNESPLKTPPKQIHIQNDRFVFGAVILGLLCLCAAIYPLKETFIGELFAADFGIFNNLTVIIYLLSIAVIALGLAEGRLEWIKVFQQGLRQGMRRIAPNLGMIVFGVFMIGEQVNWLIPLSGGESSQDTIMSVQDALIASFSATPEKAGLEAAMAIGIARFVLIFGALYALGFMVIKGKKLRGVIENPHNKDAVFYGGCFLIFWLFGMVLRTGACSGFAIFEKGTSLAQAVCLAFYCVTEFQKERTAHNQGVLRTKKV